MKSTPSMPSTQSTQSTSVHGFRSSAITWTIGLLFAAGLLLAGSDGLWFPWPNVAGVILLGIAALAAGRVSP